MRGKDAIIVANESAVNLHVNGGSVTGSSLKGCLMQHGYGQAFNRINVPSAAYQKLMVCTSARKTNALAPLYISYLSRTTIKLKC